MGGWRAAGGWHRQDRGLLFGVDAVAHRNAVFVHGGESGDGDSFRFGVGLGDEDVAPDPAFIGFRCDRWSSIRDRAGFGGTTPCAVR